MGYPQLTIGFNTPSWSNDLDDFGIPPYDFGNLHKN